ncbi:hypothetical protein evm_013855 [Chilo suppressalis]|nr:hypothetical protein evm_013855 [Chilo suppressalis]
MDITLSRNKSVPPMNQLLCTLRYFATGNFLLTVGDLGGVSVATSSRIIKRVAAAIVTLRKEFIVFPESQEEISTVKEQFYGIARFPNVIGCIDCSHIKIQSPGGDDAELFRNRNSYMSINMQTICDANLLITDVVARWPGSTHDSTIYQNSNRYRKFETGSYGIAYVLGDSGYPLKCHLLTPYLNAVTHGEHKYNEAHIKTRNTVERQYGVLKRRFPVLAVDPINDGSIPNLEELIQNGHMPQTSFISADPHFGFQRNLVTQYFDNMRN